MLKRVRPFVTPNDGFLEQLRLYQTMGNRVDVNHPDYKKFLEMHSNQDEAGKCGRRVVVLNHTCSKFVNFTVN